MWFLWLVNHVAYQVTNLQTLIMEFKLSNLKYRLQINGDDILNMLQINS